jgi:hypothetical protein
LTPLTPCAALAGALDSASHAQWTRLLQSAWAEHRRLTWAFRALCTVVGGALLVEETVVEKPEARWRGEAAWGWSRPQRTGIFGVSSGLLVWTERPIRMPLALRRWHTGGAAKFARALARRRAARNRLRGTPRLSCTQSLAGAGGEAPHIALCLVADLMVERARLDRRNTWRQCKRQRIRTAPQGALLLGSV